MLSVAAATGKVGYVYLMNGTPYDWGISVKASGSTEAVYGHVKKWIDYYRPDYVVTERIGKNNRKGEFSRAIADAIARAAQDSLVPHAYVDRVQTYANKYDEAEALAARFPELTDWIPKRRKLWEPEPRKTIIFEALALALRLE